MLGFALLFSERYKHMLLIIYALLCFSVFLCICIFKAKIRLFLGLKIEINWF